MAQQRRQSSTRKKLKPVEVVQKAREQFEELLGQQAESASGFSADGNSGWVVNLEVVELERIPQSTSLLASYEVKLDSDGDLVEYKRLRRYSRNQSDDTSEEDS
jgi:hypothetical protein